MMPPAKEFLAERGVRGLLLVLRFALGGLGHAFLFVARSSACGARGLVTPMANGLGKGIESSGIVAAVPFAVVLRLCGFLRGAGRDSAGVGMRLGVVVPRPPAMGRDGGKRPKHEQKCASEPEK